MSGQFRRNVRTVFTKKNFFEDVNGRNVIHVYIQPYYVPVKLSDVQQIHIYIKDENGNDASFFKTKVTVTLHFKKFPFLS